MSGNEAKSIMQHFEGLPPLQEGDYSNYGDVEVKALPRAQYFGGQFLARNWAMIPHVTHHDEADVTLLEAFRKDLPITEGQAKVSTPILLIKAVIAALKEFPKFNASLDASGKKLIYKKYFNIGMAVDTPNGLLVPVLKDADQKSVYELANELVELASQARDKGLPMDRMSGGSFTISSIGALGGLAFTPIINAPEVAILGVTKAYWKPTRGENDQVEWKLHIPLSLSYDHRVINGADAAKFLTQINQLVQDPQSLLESV
jgi:pyruvate dehydrogenase E2 component (dihydrolipoyllysine-residue acetyltransferase)